MRWPWVSRAQHVALAEAYERIVQHERDRRGAAETRLTLVEARYDALAEKYAAKGDAPLAIVRRAPSVVVQAIMEKAGQDRALLRHYNEFVRVQRADGTDEEAIAAAIRVGVDDDGGVPS